MARRGLVRLLGTNEWRQLHHYGQWRRCMARFVLTVRELRYPNLRTILMDGKKFVVQQGEKPVFSGKTLLFDPIATGPLLVASGRLAQGVVGFAVVFQHSQKNLTVEVGQRVAVVMHFVPRTTHDRIRERQERGGAFNFILGG